MIRSYRSREVQALLNRRPLKRSPAEIQRAALRRIRMLNRAETLQDLRVPPGNCLEALKGSREGQHSIHINDQWRICFRWEQGDAYDVDIVDCHRG
jgi:toxin HigB-1